MITEHQRVVLTHDLPEHDLKAGDIGIVVHIYGEHKGYEVEFVTMRGEHVALVSVEEHQIRQPYEDEIASVRRMKLP